MGKVIMGRAKCLTYMIEVLNNYKFNRSIENKLTSFEDVNLFIPLIVPLGYEFVSLTRKEDNNIRCFSLFINRKNNCEEVLIYFQGEYGRIENFHRGGLKGCCNHVHLNRKF
jgi:hypothetical protein